uniref:RNA-directed DNA polymerase, eukaryota, reverse transcriptase zinc-binding domain protein n=1 Tax=Tanacetum cinerariifolium TaxID=118510 RepID=A0A6L2MB23_TANCI|nr:RNA-directed DNA polymerase, eukaryota, reverse transcriptase zinc-binding domain protein [Tanacetum cinerariifolium]
MLLNGEELEEEGYHSNRICIRTKLKTAVFDYFKMVYRGMTCWVRAIEVPGWVPDFEEDGKEGYDVNDGSHEDDMYGGVSENHKDVEGNSVRQNDVHSEDPFGIYEVLNKKRDGKNINDKHEDSLKYPAGFTPNEDGDVPVEKVDNWSDENRVNNGQKDRIWARLYKESLNSRKSILKAELTDLDEVIDKGEGSDADGHRRWEVVRLIQEVEKVDAMEVAQKAKIKWSIEGDENSKYYHGMLNKKRGRLIIRGVLVDGILMESPHSVKHDFFEHFNNRFKKPNKSRVLLEGDFVKKISLEQNDDLERENIIGNDVVDAVKWFFCMERSQKEVTRLFITLIPKVPNDNMVKDFRPISLIGSLYNVIAKHLANRLVTVLDDIVDEIQSAFVTDRQILDDPFILNEIVHWCNNKKKQSMIFKVDCEKMYDSVRWDFIDDILRRFSFGEKWCFLSQKNSLWVRVVKALHGEDGKIGKKVQPSFITPKLGNGANTSFWDVAWCRDIAFKNLVPRLYALESMNNIESWSLAGSGDFSVSSVRKLIDNAILPKGISKTRWIKEIFGQEDPSMVNVYDEVVYRSFYWIRFRCKAKFSFIDWLKNPNLILLLEIMGCLFNLTCAINDRVVSKEWSGMIGSHRFIFLPRSSLYWRGSFPLLGGLFRGFGIAPFSRRTLLIVRRPPEPISYFSLVTKGAYLLPVSTKEYEMKSSYEFNTKYPLGSDDARADIEITVVT